MARAGADGVVVTGLGCVSPLGTDAASTWQALLAGRSGVTRLPDDFDPRLPVQIAARVLGPVDPGDVPAKELRRLDRGILLALAAAREALADARLVAGESCDRRPDRRRDRLGHRRHPDADRQLPRAARRGPAPRLAVLHPDDARQHAGRHGRDPPRAPRPEPLPRHGLRLRRARARRVDADPPARGRGRDGGRRHRGCDHAARGGGLREHAGAVAPERRAGPGEPALRSGPRRLRAGRGSGGGRARARGARARAWRPHPGPPASATAPPRTRCTSPRPTRRASARAAACARARRRRARRPTPWTT